MAPCVSGQGPAGFSRERASAILAPSPVLAEGRPALHPHTRHSVPHSDDTPPPRVCGLHFSPMPALIAHRPACDWGSYGMRHLQGGISR